VIGTWIDGKPLYRKVVVMNSIISGENTKDDSTLGTSLVQYFEIIKVNVLTASNTTNLGGDSFIAYSRRF